VPYFIQIGRAIASTNSPEKKKKKRQINILIRRLSRRFYNILLLIACKPTCIQR